jgi:hypothetical protein
LALIEITNEQWGKYLEKYDKLLWMISRRISGDIAIASLEDNYADLCIAALASIDAYSRKTGLKFDEFIDTKLFSQYTKTVLWNKKNNKGVKLTDRMEFRNKNVSINSVLEDDTLDIEDSRSDFSGNIVFEDLISDLDEVSRTIIGVIATDPSVITANGLLKVHSLIRPTGLSIHAINRALQNIKKTLKIKCMEDV